MDDGVAAVRRRPRRRLGWRGVRQAAGRDDDRGQLDHRRDDRTTSRTSTTPVAELPAGPGRSRARSRSPTAGASPRPAATRTPPSTWSSTSPATEQQLAFADAFGVIPSMESAAEQYRRTTPTTRRSSRAPTTPRTRRRSRVRPTSIADFNAQLESLKDGDPAAILASVQRTRCRRVVERVTRPSEPARAPRSNSGPRARDGWLFVSPAIVILGVFLVLPVLMAPG